MKKYGMFVNIVAMCWIIFLIVFLEIPYFMPVDAESMNYT
jgi:choline transport protein